MGYKGVCGIEPDISSEKSKKRTREKASFIHHEKQTESRCMPNQPSHYYYRLGKEDQTLCGRRWRWCRIACGLERFPMQLCQGEAMRRSCVPTCSTRGKLDLCAVLYLCDPSDWGRYGGLSRQSSLAVFFGIDVVMLNIPIPVRQ